MSRYINASVQSGEFYIVRVFDSEKNYCVPLNDVLETMNAYDSMLKRQDECGKTGHEKGYTAGTGYAMYHNYCPKCGADLTKGATHES